jgi:hypothetical protein
MHGNCIRTKKLINLHPVDRVQINKTVVIVD